MPGLIGIFSDDSANVERLLSIFRPYLPQDFSDFRLPNGILLAHSFDQPAIRVTGQAVMAFDGQRGLYELSDSKCEEMLADLLGGRTSEPLSLGNVVAHLESDRKTIVSTDLLASVPLYYHQDRGCVIVSSYLKPLARSVASDIDYTSVLQFLRNGFCNVGMSFFGNIKRLKPGERITFNHATQNLKSHNVSRLWSRPNQPGDIRPTKDALVKQAIDALKDAVPSGAASMLMMSGGWDSRTLLAVSGALGQRPNLYYHGDETAREHTIVKRIANDQHLDLHSEPLTAEIYAVPRLLENLKYTENTIFPHWHHAGHVARNEGTDVILSGVFGESLGGHYGPPMALRGPTQAATLMLYLIGARRSSSAGPNESNIGEAVRHATAMLAPKAVPRPWYIDVPVWESLFANSRELLKRQTSRTIDAYASRGVATTEDLVEAYITEHRGAQYINAQMLSCRRSVDVAYPFAARSVLELATEIPFEYKVHNLVNQKIIKTLAPELLRYPTAAILVNANWPILVQEGSRLVRKLTETVVEKAGHLNRSSQPSLHLGWANLDFLSDGRLLHQIVDSLRADLWDKPQMHQFISTNQTHSIHSVMDMLLKILTIDYHIS